MLTQTGQVHGWTSFFGLTLITLPLRLPCCPVCVCVCCMSIELYLCISDPTPMSLLKCNPSEETWLPDAAGGDYINEPTLP